MLPRNFPRNPVPVQPVLAVEQFQRSRDQQTFTADASSLGFPPGFFPSELFIRGEGKAPVRTFYRDHADHTPDGDVAGWWYISQVFPLRFLIVND